MAIKINEIELQNLYNVKINCKCIYKSITSSKVEMEVKVEVGGSRGGL
jgi:hypothetical protein